MWLWRCMNHGPPSDTTSRNRYADSSRGNFFSVPVITFIRICVMQDGQKRLLAFTKRGSKVHSVSSCFSPHFLLALSYGKHGTWVHHTIFSRCHKAVSYLKHLALSTELVLSIILLLVTSALWILPKKSLLRWTVDLFSEAIFCTFQTSLIENYPSTVTLSSLLAFRLQKNWNGRVERCCCFRSRKAKLLVLFCHIPLLNVNIIDTFCKEKSAVQDTAGILLPCTEINFQNWGVIYYAELYLYIPG